jgi:transposase
MFLGQLQHRQVYVCDEPVDMRKSYDTLAGLVLHYFRRPFAEGGIFLFVGKNRKRAKVLFWDGTGTCVFAKRLERGTFAAPWRSCRIIKGEVCTFTEQELALFLSGSQIVNQLSLSPSAFNPYQKSA